MRDHSSHIEMKREEAIAALCGAAAFEPGTEVVSLHDALGRVTAAACESKVALPSALCSRMDGIAVRWEDFEPLGGGIPDTSGWELGREYDWANTGTAMPAGFDTQIMIESCEFDEDGRLTIHDAPAERGAGCKQPGSEMEKGQPLLPARTRLTPAKISLLAMCGYSEIEVVRKPRVMFIPTGDELIEIGGPLPAGKAYDSNGILLEQKLLCWGAEPVLYRTLPDDWDLIRAAILEGAATCDVIAINAGSSKGSKDFTMEILEEIGTVFCHETNHGPGRHSSASVVDGVPVVGISGPPTACEITADWYLKPMVDFFLFGECELHRTVRAKLAVPMGGGSGGPGGPGGKGPGSKGGHGGPGGSKGGGPGPDFFAIKPVALKSTEAGIEIHPLPGMGMTELDDADGYLTEHPRKYGSLEAGDELTVELRYPYTSM